MSTSIEDDFLPTLSDEGMENLNRSDHVLRDWTEICASSTKKSLGLDGLAGEFYQTLKESMPILSNLL